MRAHSPPRARSLRSGGCEADRTMGKLSAQALTNVSCPLSLSGRKNYTATRRKPQLSFDLNFNAFTTCPASPFYLTHHRVSLKFNIFMMSVQISWSEMKSCGVNSSTRNDILHSL